MSATENEKQQIEKLREEAQKHTQAAKEAASSGRESNWEWARHAMIMHDQSLYRYEGFESFDNWAEATGFGDRSGCRAWLRRYQELSKSYEHDDLKSLKGSNAELLLSLPVKSRTDAMLRKAVELTNDKLREVVERVLQKAAPAGQPAPELTAPLKIKTSTSQKKFIDGAMTDFAKKNGLEQESSARILELMVAECVASELSDTQLLVAYLVPELRAAVDMIEDKEHEPEWRLQQCGFRLRRAFEAVLKPQEVIKRVRQDSNVVPAATDQTSEQALEAAKNFFNQPAKVINIGKVAARN